MSNPQANPDFLWESISELKDLAIDDGRPVEVADIRREIGRIVRDLERVAQAWEQEAKSGPGRR